MKDVNELFEERIKICKECPLYLEKGNIAVCNPKLYISISDKQTVSKTPKIGFRSGCNCNLFSKNRVPNSKCIVGKW